jgi:hypothetical protein
MLNKNKSPYELISKQNSVKPNYDLSGKDFCFNVYVSHTQDVCIVCKIDNNYISGLAFSTVSSLERNQSIINSMVCNAGLTISTEFSVLGREKFNEICKWYKLVIIKSPDFNDDKHYKTQRFEAGCQFLQSGISRAIASSFEKLSDKCFHRISGGLYISVLEKYYEILSRYKRSDKESHGYYHKVKNLIDIVDAESYLRLSQDNRVRELYLSIHECTSALYGAYMDVAR